MEWNLDLVWKGRVELVERVSKVSWAVRAIEGRQNLQKVHFAPTIWAVREKAAEGAEGSGRLIYGCFSGARIWDLRGVGRYRESLFPVRLLASPVRLLVANEGVVAACQGRTWENTITITLLNIGHHCVRLISWPCPFRLHCAYSTKYGLNLPTHRRHPETPSCLPANIEGGAVLPTSAAVCGVRNRVEDVGYMARLRARLRMGPSGAPGPMSRVAPHPAPLGFRSRI